MRKERETFTDTQPIWLTVLSTRKGISYREIYDYMDCCQRRNEQSKSYMFGFMSEKQHSKKDASTSSEKCESKQGFFWNSSF